MICLQLLRKISFVQAKYRTYVYVHTYVHITHALLLKVVFAVYIIPATFCHLLSLVGNLMESVYPDVTINDLNHNCLLDGDLLAVKRDENAFHTDGLTISLSEVTICTATSICHN